MPLAVKIDGDPSGFIQAMAKARAVAAVTADAMKSKFEDTAKDIAGSFSKRLGAGLLLGLGGVAAVVGTFKAIEAAVDASAKKLEELEGIAKRALKADVGTTFLQQWEKQAKGLGVEVDTLTAALNKLQEAAQPKLGGGDLQKVLGAHQTAGNISASAAAGILGAGSQEERLRLILDLLRQMEESGKRLAALDIAGKLLGSGFEESMRRSVTLVEDLRRSLDKPAADIIDEGTINRAVQLKERLEEAERTLRDGLKPLYDALAEIGSRHNQSWVEIVELMARAVTLAGNLGSVLSQVVSDANAKFQGFFGRLNQQLQARGLLDSTGQGGLGGLGVGTPGALRTDTDRFGAEQLLRDRMSRGAVEKAKRDSQSIEAGVFGDKSNTLEIKKNTQAKKENAGSSKEALNQIENLIVSMERANALLRVEVETYGQSNIVKSQAVAMANAEAAAKRAQIPLSEKQIEQIRREAIEQGKLKDKIKEQVSARELQGFVGNQMVDVLMQATEAGAKLEDVMLGVAKAIARAALQALILGEGPLAGLFGTKGQGGATGGWLGLLTNSLIPKAGGGPIVPGQPYLVGEKGPEIIVPQSAGTVLPNGAMGGVTIHQTIDARGAQVGVADQIAAALAANNRALQVSLPTMIRSAQSRGAIR